ncbi:protein-glutamate O-methyltransferase CheR [Siccirubricoccus sp. KC 17139]|uniref:protein-glutamate O-methyltransferase n=1 Tax=Siccirubricoccus soli TaxID=2899147 RepID=A0ABT1CZ22_9PROT|nr:protein-glutamate O-methyltransferase CheR [Siccirubricoccus soli]MCO6414901.1 protein-glutamate O-methyltransferase CheR [Siccirubricoccus soli]MCP2681031.1 protein-glutamate O-methyltransferase CheR [Siccirubricoccus soli]
MSPDGFAFIAGLVKARSGLVLTPDKQYMLDTRLGPILKREGLASLDALALKLREPRALALAEAVTEALTTNESSFFRDGKPFEHLKRLLPALAAARPPGATLRVWSAACSTGQEAYSIAMLVQELGAETAGRKVEILGTDISQEVLSRAREGFYTQFEVQRGLPAKLMVKYLHQEAGRWRVNPPLRAMARFEHLNLLADFRHLGRFDVIFCRNVLIYFDTPTKTRVLNALAERLAADGVLYLGGAETVLGLTDQLIALPAERGAYERRQAVAKAG